MNTTGKNKSFPLNSNTRSPFLKFFDLVKPWARRCDHSRYEDLVRKCVSGRVASMNCGLSDRGLEGDLKRKVGREHLGISIDQRDL